MGATTLLGRSAMRGRWRGHIALLVLVIVGAGTALASLTAAWRTDHAYSDYLRRARVSHLVINPLFITDRLLEVVRTTPGVESMSMSRLLNVATDDIDPAQQEEFGDSTQVLGTVGGRYIDVDRPNILEGRMLSAADEIIVNRGASAAYDLDVGDEISVTFLPSQPNGPSSDPDPTPIGEERVKVVGIGVLADEVLPDDLYTSIKIIFSPELTAKYSCILEQPASDDTSSLDELNAYFFPADCASDAALLSLYLTEGDDGVDDVLSALDERVAQLNAELPAALQQNNYGFQVIPTVTSVETERVRRSVEPVVLALRLFGLAVVAATTVLAGVAVHRTTRETDAETQIWSQLGVGRSQRMLAVASPTAIVIVVGLVGAFVAGWLASGIGPLASVSVLDPSPSLGIPAALIVAVLPGVLVMLGATLMLSAWKPAPRATLRTHRESTNRLADAAAKTGDVPLALGVHAAVRGRNRGGSGILLGAAAFAIAVGTGALVYSSNVVALVSHPDRYGWTYDIGATINAGFEGASPDRIAASLDRPEVAGWGIGATALSASINGVKLPAIADVRGLADLGLPIVDGEPPRGDHEVALGSNSADRLGLSVGDHISVETDFGDRDATVTGIVVLPSIGAFLSDRAGLGTGILLSAPFYLAVISEMEAAADVPAGTFYDMAGGFVAIDLRDGVDGARFIESLGDDILTWDELLRKPAVHVEPVRPAQIADLAAVRAAPLLLAGLIGVTIIIGLMASLARAIRVRRRELAVLRSLGCRSSQIYATVVWQALTIVMVGLVVGVPLGIIAGSTLWRRFAKNLGIQPVPRVPWGWTGVVVVAVVVAAVGAAVISGRRAAADRAVAVLRET